MSCEHGVMASRLNGPRRRGQSVNASLSNQSACDTLNYDEVVCGAERTCDHKPNAVP